MAILKSKIQNLKKTQAGFSLTETLIVVALLLLITPVILYFLWGGFLLNSRASGTIVNQRVARQAIDKMTKDLREITVGDDNQYPLETCSPLEITFYADYDLDDATERVRYYVETEQLKRGTIEPVGDPATYSEGNEVISTMINDVLNDGSYGLFEYYDENYDGTGSALSAPVDCSVVRLVDVRFKIDTVIEKQPGPFHLTSKVQLRNLKNNL